MDALLTAVLAVLGVVAGFATAGIAGVLAMVAVARPLRLWTGTVSLGIGPAWYARTWRRGSLVVRWLPLWASASLVLTRQRLVRTRVWLCSLVSVTVMLLVAGAVYWGTAGPVGGWGWGWAAGSLTAVAVTCWPLTSNPVGSHGAVLLRLPLLSEAGLRPLLADPVLTSVYASLATGEPAELARAERLLTELGDHPLGRYGRTALHLARGEYREAVAVAAPCVTDPAVSEDPRWGAVSPGLRFDQLAAALLLAGEAEHLPVEQWLPAAGGALGSAAQAGCPSRLLAGSGALYSALTGEYAEARALGLRVLARAQSPGALVDAHLTLALAGAGLGREREAWHHLDRARRFRPHEPRGPQVTLRVRRALAAAIPTGPSPIRD